MDTQKYIPEVKTKYVIDTTGDESGREGRRERHGKKENGLVLTHSSHPHP
jgi:hypothetical protein